MAPKFQKGPDLKRFMVSPAALHILSVPYFSQLTTIKCLLFLCQDKRLRVSLNGNRRIIGTLRGYDAFLNVVLEQVENESNGEYLGQVVLRGNSIVQFEGLERVS